MPSWRDTGGSQAAGVVFEGGQRTAAGLDGRGGGPRRDRSDQGTPRLKRFARIAMPLHGIPPRYVAFVWITLAGQRNADYPLVLICVAGSASNACFPFAAHRLRACSPWSLWSLSAIQSSAP